MPKVAIAIVESRNLPIPEEFTTFVEFSLGSSAVNTEPQKSSNPIYNEGFECDYHDKNENLNFRVFSGVSNELIGEIGIPISTLAVGKNDSWYELPVSESYSKNAIEQPIIRLGFDLSVDESPFTTVSRSASVISRQPRPSIIDIKNSNPIKEELLYSDRRNNSTFEVSQVLSNEDSVKVIFYLSNILASVDQPFTLCIDDQPIFKCSNTINKNDLAIIDIVVAKPLPGINGVDLVFVLGLKIPRIKVEHNQKVNINKSGCNIKIYLDDVKKIVQIVQEKVPFEIPKEVNVISSVDLNLLNKNREKQYVEQVKLYAVNLPASPECPFKIFFDKVLIYQFDTPVNELMVLAINLTKRTENLSIMVKYKGFEDGLEADFNLIEGGSNIRISTNPERDGEIEFKQQHVEDFSTSWNKIEQKKATIRFYLVGCEASEDKPLLMKLDGRLFHTSTNIQKPVFGVSTEIIEPFQVDEDNMKMLEFYSKKQNIHMKTILNFTKHGKFVKIEVAKDNINCPLSVEQCQEEFKFTFSTQSNGSKKVVSTNSSVMKLSFDDIMVGDEETSQESGKFISAMDATKKILSRSATEVSRSSVHRGTNNLEQL